MVTISKAAARRPARCSDASGNIIEHDVPRVSGRAIPAGDAMQSRWKQQVAHHDKIGRRANSIVKNMLRHWRSGPGEHRATDLNTTVEETYTSCGHGARGAFTEFVITLPRKLAASAGVRT